MATQCEVNNAHNQQHFVSSNAYYGYVPVAPVSNGENNSEDNCMDVDNNECPMMQQEKNNYNGFNAGKQQMIFADKNFCSARKRTFDQEEFIHYMPRFKKFKEGTIQEYHVTLQTSINKSSEFGFRTSDNWIDFSRNFHSKEACQHRSASQQMCRSSLLLLNTTKSKMTDEPIKSQDLRLKSKYNDNEELENMLFLTHGCSSYHHYGEEAEF